MKSICQPAMLAIMTLSLGVPSAPAQTSQVEIGTLSCSGEGGVGMILGSRKSFDCRFNSTGGGGSETYTAIITRYGLDIGITGPTTIVWTVLAASAALPERALVGGYVGASADISAGLGGGANLLVGGSARSIALQPLSIQGQTGVNLALGVAGLELR